MTENVRTPIVKIASGRKSARQLRQLKRGRGRLVTQVDRQIVSFAQATGDENTIEVPIVVEPDPLSFFK
jgi:hypothetical protein